MDLIPNTERGKRKIKRRRKKMKKGKEGERVWKRERQKDRVRETPNSPKIPNANNAGSQVEPPLPDNPIYLTIWDCTTLWYLHQ